MAVTDFNKLNEKQKTTLDRLVDDPKFYKDVVTKLENQPEKQFKLVQQVERYSLFREENRPKRTDIGGATPALFGLGDELAAGSAVVGQAIRNVLDPSRKERGLGQRTYSDYLKEIRAEEEQFREAFPKQALATEIGGGTLLAASGAPLVAGAAKGIGLARAVSPASSYGGQIMRKYVAPGALAGGTYGFAEGEGGFLNRASEVPLGAGVGAGTGLGLGVGVDILGAGLKAVSPRFAKSSFLRDVTETVGGKEKALEDVRAGKTLIEQGDGSVSKLARSRLESDFPARESVRGFLREEVAEKQDKLFNQMFKGIESDDLNIPREVDEDIFTYSDRIISQNAEIKKNLYEKALRNEDGSPKLVPSDVRKQVDRFTEESNFKNIPDKAKQNIEDYVDVNQEKIFKIDDNGKLIINKQNLDYEDMDNLSRALSITLDKSDLRFMNTVKAVNRLSDDFKDILDSSNPLIKDARIQSAKSFRIEEIYKKAEKDFKNIRPSEFIKFVDDSLKLADNKKLGLTEDEILQTIRRGILTKMDETMLDVGTGAKETTFIKSLRNPKSPNYRILKKVFPEENFDELIDNVESVSGAKIAQTRFDESSRSAEALKERTPIELPLIGDVIERFLRPFNLSASDKRDVATILIEKNPDIVKRAMDDTRYAGVLERLIPSAIASVSGQDPERALQTIF